MPCNCDHLEPSLHEAESKRVAELIVWLSRQLGFDIHPYIVMAAGDPYGNAEKVHELTKTLCYLIKGMSSKEKSALMYDGRIKEARKLADWWEEHQAADLAKEQELRQNNLNAFLKVSALAKLTPEEREALGL